MAKSAVTVHGCRFSKKLNLAVTKGLVSKDYAQSVRLPSFNGSVLPFAYSEFNLHMQNPFSE